MRISHGLRLWASLARPCARSLRERGLRDLWRRRILRVWRSEWATGGTEWYWVKMSRSAMMAVFATLNAPTLRWLPSAFACGLASCLSTAINVPHCFSFPNVKQWHKIKRVRGVDSSKLDEIYNVPHWRFSLLRKSLVPPFLFQLCFQSVQKGLCRVKLKLLLGRADLWRYSKILNFRLMQHLPLNLSHTHYRTLYHSFFFMYQSPHPYQMCRRGKLQTSNTLTEA